MSIAHQIVVRVDNQRQNFRTISRGVAITGAATSKLCKSIVRL